MTLPFGLGGTKGGGRRRRRTYRRNRRAPDLRKSGRAATNALAQEATCFRQCFQAAPRRASRAPEGWRWRRRRCCGVGRSGRVVLYPRPQDFFRDRAAAAAAELVMQVLQGSEEIRHRSGNRAGTGRTADLRAAIGHIYPRQTSIRVFGHVPEPSLTPNALAMVGEVYGLLQRD